MVDEPDSLTLRYLRKISADQQVLRDDMQDLKQRMTTVEIAVGNAAASEATHYASLSARLDRYNDRLERLERRLDLVDITPIKPGEEP